MKENLWLTLVTCLAYCIGKELWKAKQLTRELLEQTTVLFTPETILSWYRKLIAQKYDGSKNRKNPGRPKLSQELVDLVIRFKEENPRRGYTRIRDYLVYLGHKIGETTVKNILIENGYPAYYVTGRCRAPEYDLGARKGPIRAPFGANSS